MISWLLNALWTVLKAIVYLLSIMVSLQWQGILMCILFGIFLLFYYANKQHDGLRGFCDVIAALFVHRPFYWILEGLYKLKHLGKKGA